MNDERIEQLALRHLDGGLDPAEQGELDAALQQDPAAARRLKQLADQELLLAEAFGGRPARVPILTARRWNASPPLRVAALAAAALGAALLLYSSRARPSAPSYEGSALLRVDPERGAAPVPVAQPDLASAVTYLARSGACRLGAARIEFTAPTLFSLPHIAHRNARQPIAIHAGAARVDVGRRSPGILIETRAGTLRDVGTSFSVELTTAMEEPAMIARFRAGALPLFLSATVFSGTVMWQSADGQEQVIKPDMGRVTLAHDTSAGSIADRQGVVLVRPVLAPRWALAEPGAPIEPGTWVKTPPRGAHAAELRLRDGARLVLGPGSLLEVAEPGALRLDQGELHAEPAPESPLRIAGPGGAVLELVSPATLRADRAQLLTLAEPPPWLAGYQAQAPSEALGSLLANIDGRNVPLTIGYHKVTADIRDQIARTEIEESFVNHTDQTLEGVFSFPLPHDASISGFGMWIDGELVEADVVEKQRAREIYETILREKRDPGLLEWTSGNIFKARVYPIPGRSEKRIRIVYTQVLPKTETEYRYLYALRSEMLRVNPLRELAITVRVASAEQLAAVECPSHAARIRKSEHAAQVELAASDYVPDRDFEVRIRTEKTRAGATFVTHRRDDDGFFLLLLSAGAPTQTSAPPAAAPLDLILIADTSGSMTDSQLDAQRAFIAGLLESLAETDRFNLLAFDVQAKWAFPERTAPTPAAIEQVRALLERRGGLGWTDLDLAFREACARTGTNTHVIYVGDGILTTGDADPVSFLARFKQLDRGDGHFHTVAVGSTHDLSLLRGVAAAGRGSLHTVSDSSDAPAAANALLAEITSPGLRDLALAWDGIRVARVYPETLPNLPAGRQQIVIGRFLPEPRELAGTVTISGMLGDQPFTHKLPIQVSQTDAGNSFIPRLWARHHLDHLLAQGRSAELVDQIVTLSQDYQIMTPYTSFLVLESDADRERFQVAKRMRMRGGEEFFAAGADAARTELLAQQMRLSMRWRQGLRAQFLRMYEDMGESLRMPEQTAWSYGGYGGMAGGSMRRLRRSAISDDKRNYWFDGDWDMNGRVEYLGEPVMMNWSWSERGLAASEDGMLVDSLAWQAPMSAGLDDFGDAGFDLFFADAEVAHKKLAPLGGPAPASSASTPFFSLGVTERYDMAGRPSTRGVRRADAGAFGLAYRTNWRPPSPLASLFPQINTPVPHGPRVTDRPPELRRILERCNRRALLAETQAALRIDTEFCSVDSRGRQWPASTGTLVVAPDAWALTRRDTPEQTPFTQWVRGDLRGALHAARKLAATRPAKSEDRRDYPAPLEWYFDDLRGAFPEWSAGQQQEGNTALVTFVADDDGDWTNTIKIDTARNVITEGRSYRRGRQERIVTFSDFTDVAGLAWPQRIETRDRHGRITHTTRVTYQALPPEAVTAELERELGPLAESIVLELPLPKLAEAKQRAQDGAATFADRWTLINHYAATQRWAEVQQQAGEAERLVQGMSGMDWIRLAILMAARRNDDACQLALALADRIVAADSPSELGLARHLYQSVPDALSHAERLALLDRIEPVFNRAALDTRARDTWHDWRLSELDQLNRAHDALALRAQLASTYPDDAARQVEYAYALARMRGLDSAIAHLTTALRDGAPWPDDQAERLNSAIADLLFSNRRLREYIRFIDDRVEAAPDTVDSRLLDRYISAHVMLDREPEANSLIATWLRAELGPDAPAIANARFDAALAHALAEGDTVRSDRVDRIWHQLLSETARRLAADPERAAAARRILEHWRFRDTDTAAAARAALYREMVAQVETLAPAALERLWLASEQYAPAEGEPPRDRLLAMVLARWEQERDKLRRRRLAAIIDRSGNAQFTLPLHRAQLAAAADPHARTEAAQSLFDLLLGQGWSQALEDELCSILPQLGEGDDRAAAQAGAIARITQFLIQARTQQRIDAIPERTAKSAAQLRPIEAEARRQALANVLPALVRVEDLALEPGAQAFAAIERITVEAKLDHAPRPLFDELSALFRAIPAPAPDTEQTATIDQLRSMLAERALRVLARLATRPDADPALADELFDLLNGAASRESKVADVRRHVYQLLTVLDRPAEIEAALRKWAQEDGEFAGNQWRVPLGYVLAEQGALADAIAVFEAIAASDELGPAEWRALATWYLASAATDKSREAQIRAYQTAEEWQIRQQLEQQLQQYRRAGAQVPEELDQDALDRFAALLRKATNPEWHLALLSDYYETTKDFRLLEALPEAVLGQSAGSIYAALQGMRRPVEKIDDEATADRLLAHLRARRREGLTPTDTRALALLEFLVERRAADQASGAASHQAAALEALRQAEKPAWTDGEPVLMARLLASTGSVVEPIRTELLRQLRAMHAAAAAGSQDRFQIGVQHAAALWANERQDDAITTLAAALDEYRAAHGGRLPTDANGALTNYASYLEATRAFPAAEQMWRSELAGADSTEQRDWLTPQLFWTALRALQQDAQLACGRGADLYRAVHDELMSTLVAQAEARHVGELVRIAAEFSFAAHEKRLPDAGPDMRQFAFTTLPEVLRARHYNEGQDMVRVTAERMRGVLGHRAALEFLVTRAETEPAWLRRQDNDFWRENAWILGDCRVQAGDLGDLESRLVSVICREIARDLGDRRARQRYQYHQHMQHYWREQADAFAATALEVLQQETDSLESVRYIADYLAQGLDRHEDAIAALLDCHHRRGLDEAGIQQLATCMHHVGRHAETLPILTAAIEKWPWSLELRVLLMRACHYAGRRDALEQARAAAHEYFRADNRWQENVMARLGEVCLETNLPAFAADYCAEAIATRLRENAAAAAGDEQLSSYYATQARAFAALGRTRQAVDAAAGAILARGRKQEDRAAARQTLLDVLRSAPDLDAWITEFEAEVARSGQDSPIIRQALGAIFTERKQWQAAQRQLEAAIECGDADETTYRLLIDAYRQGGDAAQAAARLLALARQLGHTLALYKELGDEWIKLERPDAAERAYTTLAEMSAEESEGHALLAQVRTAQQRFLDAAEQWRQVIRIRTKEPAGYLGLAEALAASGDTAAARELLEQVLGKSWPAHFGDTRERARELVRKLPEP